jgi:hypothetical protein
MGKVPYQVSSRRHKEGYGKNSPHNKKIIRFVGYGKTQLLHKKIIRFVGYGKT